MTDATLSERLRFLINRAPTPNMARLIAEAADAIDRLTAPQTEKVETHDPGAPHLIDGEFQSDKYPTTPRGKVPLSTKDATAQDLLWEYAQRRRVVDAEFAADLEASLRKHGYEPPVGPSPDQADEHVQVPPPTEQTQAGRAPFTISGDGRCHVCGAPAQTAINVAPDAASGGAMLPVCADHIPERFRSYTAAELAKAVAEERERCALVVDNAFTNNLSDIAAAIRIGTT